MIFFAQPATICADQALAETAALGRILLAPISRAFPKNCEPSPVPKDKIDPTFCSKRQIFSANPLSASIMLIILNRFEAKSS
jgi:hypothetical protein